MRSFFLRYSPAKLIAVTSALTIAIIIVLSLSVQLKVNQVIAQQSTYASEINLSGFQRMLSQRIAYYCSEYFYYNREEDKKIALESMLLLKARHDVLVEKYKRTSPSEKTINDELYFLYLASDSNLDDKISRYQATVMEFLDSPNQATQDNLFRIKDKSSQWYCPWSKWQINSSLV